MVGKTTLKNFEDMYNRLDSIPACDGWTYGQTDRQTKILQRYSLRYAYASRGKKMCVFVSVRTSSNFHEF